MLRKPQVVPKPAPPPVGSSNTSQTGTTKPTVPFKEFLESVPPGRTVLLPAGTLTSSTNIQGQWDVEVPELSLYCNDIACERFQFFAPKRSSIAAGDSHAQFTCRNCQTTLKTYSLRFTSDSDPGKNARVVKFGEIPQFGPPLPAKLLQLAGHHGDILKKGRRSENQSLGIGAFAYYRRVVELQKNFLIDEVAKAVTRLGGNTNTLAALRKSPWRKRNSRPQWN